MSRALREIVRNSNCANSKCKVTSKQKQILLRDLKNAAESFDEYIVKRAGKHKKTKLYVFFPPYSCIRYAQWQQENQEIFKTYLSFISHVVNQADSQQNLYVFGFDDLPFLDDIKNYKDPIHYHQRYNSSILYSMKNQQNLLTKTTIEDYKNIITKLATNYDLKALSDYFEGHLK